jgi:FKBP-type peptidyl-prolyl cis-trans isomerase 2
VFNLVTELSGPVASVDFNHPLAGKHLIIDVNILNVESASSQDGMQMGSQEEHKDISI